jgi:phosphatidylserine decarboxylase
MGTIIRALSSFLSHIVGFLSDLELGPSVQPYINRLFVKLNGIDMSEAAEDTENFPSIQKLFTRVLRDGARPPKGGVVSPADGTVLFSRSIHSSVQVQAKGLHYHLDELVYGRRSESEMAHIGWCNIVYLAPSNYHRVHSPLSGEIKQVRYFPGQLWSVSPKMLNFIPNLYSSNERLVFDIECANGEVAYVVMVGALNVARMQCSVPGSGIDLRHTKDAKNTTFDHLAGTKVEAGQELGIFMLGSTVVSLFPKDFARTENMVTLDKHCFVKMGESL